MRCEIHWHEHGMCVMMHVKREAHSHTHTVLSRDLGTTVGLKDLTSHSLA